MKKKIAVIGGGYSNEKVVSMKSMNTLLTHINSDKYDTYSIIIDDSGWGLHYENEIYPIDKTDFSVKVKDLKINFDFAFITIHGTPGEDGRLQAYFDLLDIPYSTPGFLASSITANKFFCNTILKQQGLDCANSLIIRENDVVDIEKLEEEIGFPCFIKPVDGGSSFGVTKVKEKKEVIPAVKKAFEHGSEVMVEEFMKGVEVTTGVFKEQRVIKSLPVTEIVSENEFFDYEAKYKGESKEITPARLSDKVTKTTQEIAREVYKVLNLKGMSRIDFIIQNDIPFVLEVNTTPGLSEQSIIPQQVRYIGNTLENFFGMCIEENS